MSEQFNPALKPQQPENTNASVGLSPGDLLTLPDHQRRIVNWIIRHQESTLPEVAEHLGEDEPTAKNELDLLVKQGLIQEITGVGESRYSVKLAAKRGSHLSDKLYQSLTPNKPLTLIINPSGDTTVGVGSTFELSVTVSNTGSQSALVNIYIDEVSGILREWCVSPYQRLALNSGHNSEVVFQMKVPVEALLGSYDYTLVVDASEHYPKETPLLHKAKLQVIAPNLNEDE